jgi:Xaa-Pro aminopeptidase
MGWPAAEGSVIEGHSDAVIQRGDLLHTDVGIHYLRLCTDTQEMGYVLRPGEADVPEGLKRAMAIGNRWQDLLTTSFELGRTGNEILAATRAKADAEGITCSVYTHPLGFHGHGSGPTIGMWDNQGPTPLRGDWPLHADTCYAIEGNVTVPIPERRTGALHRRAANGVARGALSVCSQGAGKARGNRPRCGAHAAG